MKYLLKSSEVTIVDALGDLYEIDIPEKAIIIGIQNYQKAISTPGKKRYEMRVRLVEAVRILYLTPVLPQKLDSTT